MKIKIDLTKMSRFKDAVQKRILKKAQRAGAKPVINAVKSRVPKVTKALQKSIGSKTDAIKGTLIVYTVVGPKSRWERVIKGRLKKPSRYAHLIEKGRHRNPFLMPAWRSTQSVYFETVKKVIGEEMNKELAKG